jgi:hypothetical protein
VSWLKWSAGSAQQKNGYVVRASGGIGRGNQFLAFSFQRFL